MRAMFKAAFRAVLRTFCTFMSDTRVPSSAKCTSASSLMEREIFTSSTFGTSTYGSGSRGQITGSSADFLFWYYDWLGTYDLVFSVWLVVSQQEVWYELPSVNITAGANTIPFTVFTPAPSP